MVDFTPSRPHPCDMGALPCTPVLLLHQPAPHAALPAQHRSVPLLHHVCCSLTHLSTPLPIILTPRPTLYRPTVRDVRLRKEDLPALPTAAAAPRAPKAPRQSAGTAYTDPAAASTRATTGLGATAAASGVSRGTWQDLTPQHLHLIASADTFFIATCYQPPPGRAGGVTEVRR